MPSKYLNLPRYVALIFAIGIATGNATAADTDPEGRKFEPSEDAVADVQQAIERAAGNDRLALVVLGANWCHDSRALAARLFEPPLSDVIEKQYELTFVDVGFLDHGRDVTQQFGVANYYATPTVLIIDPSSGETTNDDDRHIWGNAYNIEMQTSVEYFESHAAGVAEVGASAASAGLLKAYADIDGFEQELADRVDGGYAVVGPMLAAYKDGNAPDNFDDAWNELRDFRMAIPGDIGKLREQARERAMAGEEDIQLTYPEYPPLSWEEE